MVKKEKREERIQVWLTPNEKAYWERLKKELGFKSLSLMMPSLAKKGLKADEEIGILTQQLREQEEEHRIEMLGFADTIRHLHNSVELNTEITQEIRKLLEGK